MDPALPLQAHPRFGQALAALGRAAVTVPLGAGGALGSALVLRRALPFGGSVGALIRGPCWAANVGVWDRASALAALPIHLIEAEAPCPGVRLAGFRQVATAAHVAEIDLTPTREARRAALDGKWRNHLRRAERSRLHVAAEAFAGDLGHWLLQREAALRRARRYRALPQAVACAYARVDPGAARLYVARLGDEPVAGMLMLLHAPVATYHLGWNGDRGRALAAHHLLLARVCDDLAQEGFARLDLGTLDTEASPGLARFKIGAGARVRALGGSWLRLPGARRLALRGRSV